MIQRVEGEPEFVDAGGASAYMQFRHGIDGAKLLDPIFTGLIEAYGLGREVIDAGCGAAPWAILAADAGAKAVFAFDSSQQMLDQAEEALRAQSDAVRRTVTLALASVFDIPKPTSSFDTALSVNVGCALPTLPGHFREVARVLNPGGIAIVTAPASLEVPFTTFGDEEEKIARLETDLEAVTDEAEMRQVVGGHTDILRASVVADGARYRLVKETGSLGVGQAIHRKIPGLVVPNYNHPQEDYEAGIEAAGFNILETTRSRLAEDEYTAHTGLGWQYVDSAPFDIYLLQNPVE